MVKRIKKLYNTHDGIKGWIVFGYKMYGKLLGLLYYAFRIFPIKENKIVACAQKGARYGDNPKYILDEFIRQGLDYQLVWLLDSKDTTDLPPEITPVPYHFLSRAYHLSTAKVWIDSNMKDLGVRRRPGQCYLQTWHGSYGFKKEGYDIPGEREQKYSVYNVDRAHEASIETLRVSNSKMQSAIHRSAHDYMGEILECGSPRNDIFFEDPAPYQKKVRAYFGLAQDTKLVLYAPTYRHNFGVDVLQMDFMGLKSALEQRFGGTWAVLIRLHYNNIGDAKKFIQYSDCILNATDYHVMQELLVVSDVLISDYSSCMLDFITKPKPCFIYATDLEDFRDDRGLYFDFTALPMPVATDQQGLESAIRDFDEAAYMEAVRALHEQVGLCETGHACQQVVAYIQAL